MSHSNSSKIDQSKPKTVEEVKLEILERKLKIQAQAAAKLKTPTGGVVDLMALPSFKKKSNKSIDDKNSESKKDSQTIDKKSNVIEKKSIKKTIPTSPISKITKKPLKLSNKCVL